MKNFLLLLTLSFIFPLFSEHLTLNTILNTYISNHLTKEKCLLVGFESEQKIHENSNSLQRIVAFNQPLEALQKLKYLLKPHGHLIAFYMPSESHHWRIVRMVCGENFTDHLLETNRYRIALTVSFQILNENIYKGIAHYPSKEALITEIQNKPSIWGREIERHVHLLPEGNASVGYRILEFILKK